MTEFSQQKGIGWQMKHLPRRSLPGEGPLCSVVKDNVSIQRLSHSRSPDWGGCEDWERLRPFCIPSQRLSLFLELWSSEALGANKTCSLRCLWKLLSEGCFHLAPTGIKFNPSWMHRGEHSFCLALWWLNCTSTAGGRWNEGFSQQHPSPFFSLCTANMLSQLWKVSLSCYLLLFL